MKEDLVCGMNGIKWTEKLEHNYTGYGSLYTTWYENGQKKSEERKIMGEKKRCLDRMV